MRKFDGQGLTVQEEGITFLSTMKTVTIKADDDFDALLTGLAGRLNTTKSRVIRDAVRNYRRFLDREALKVQIREASLKTRQQSLDTALDLRAADSDGL